MSKLRLFALAFVACSPATPAPKVEGQPILTTPDASAPPLPTPARWSLYSESTFKESASMAVGEDTLILSIGERWLLHATTTGDMDGAPNVAPEPLAAVARGGPGYRFLAESGALYEAPAPLAPLTRAGDGVGRVVERALGQASALVIDGAGDLLRTLDGKSWRRVDVTPRDGVFRDVAMHGRDGLLLAAPQRLYATKDDGATWRPITPPGEGARGLFVAEDRLLVRGASESFAWDPKSDSFAPFSLKQSAHKNARKTKHTAAMDGHLGVLIESEGSAHRVAILEPGSVPTFKALAQLDGCWEVHAAVRARTIMLACDGAAAEDGSFDKTGSRSRAPRWPAGDAGGAATGMITKLLRSDDGGRSFQEDATFDGGIAHDAPIFLGDGGFVFLGTRCREDNASRCAPARVRASAQSAWTTLSVDADAPRFVALASRSGQPVYGLGVNMNGSAVYKLAGDAPMLVAELHVGAPSSPSIDVDDAGVVRGFVHVPKAFAFALDGTKVTPIDLPEHTSSAAFAGKLGLASTGAQGYETIDGGKTWHRVALPQFAAVSRCTDDGCVTTRGLRAGWEGAAQMMNEPKKERRFGKGLKCVASGAWTPLGGGDLPTVDGVDHGASRWLHPTRDLPGAVTLNTNAWSAAETALTKVPLMGPAPQPPTHGAQTQLRVQPSGVLALRYSYLRARREPGVYNPVDMQAAWYRSQSGKIFRGALPKLAPFRVAHDPQPYYLAHEGRAGGQSEIPELAWIGPKGLDFHSPEYEGADEWTVTRLRDDGKIEKVKLAPLQGNTGQTVDAPGLTVVSQDTGQWFVASAADRKKATLGVMGGDDDDDAPVSIFDIGGKPSFVGTSRWTQRAWTIPISTGADLPQAAPLATQLTLFDKPCDPSPITNASRVILPWVWGSRRAVVVEVDGETRALATSRSSARVQASGDACMTAMEAGGDDDDSVVNEDEDLFSALIFPGDLKGSVLFRASHGAWPRTIAVRSIACALADFPLPEDLADRPGFAAR